MSSSLIVIFLLEKPRVAAMVVINETVDVPVVPLELDELDIVVDLMTALSCLIADRISNGRVSVALIPC